MHRAKPLPPDQRRQTIIAAAKPLLLQSGANFTTKQVAQAAQIAEGTIFRVFPTKNDLVHAVVEDVFNPTVLCAEIASLPIEAELATRVQDIVDLVAHNLREIFLVIGSLAFAKAGQDRTHLHQLHVKRREKVLSQITEALMPWADELAVEPSMAANAIFSFVLANAHINYNISAGAGQVTKTKDLTPILLYGVIKR